MMVARMGVLFGERAVVEVRVAINPEEEQEEQQAEEAGGGEVEAPSDAEQQQADERDADGR